VVPAVELAAARVVENGPKFPKKLPPGNHVKQDPPEKHPLPAWAQILISGFGTLLLFGIWWKIMSARNNPVPRGDSERLAVVLQDALEKVRSLEEQLETRQEVNDMFEDSENEDEPLDATATAERAALDRQRAESRRTREIHEAAARTAEQSQKLIDGADRVQKEFTAALGQTRDYLEDFAKIETSGIYSDLNKAVAEPSANFKKWEPPSWMTDEGTLRLPPLMQLVSGVFATSQIRLARYFNRGGATLDMILIALSVVTFVLNWKKRCGDPLLWVWHIGLLSLSVIDLIVRTMIVRKATKSIEFLMQGRTVLEKEDSNANGGGMLEVFASFQRKSSRFFDAFFKYSNLMESWPSFFSNVLNVLGLIWGAVGLGISVENILVDSLDCDATLAMHYMHTYSFFFVMLLTWKVLGLLQWILDAISGSRHVRTPIVKMAKHCDDESLKGMPIVMSFVQSFVLKDSSDFYSMKSRKAVQELMELEEEAKQLEERLRHRKNLRQQLKERSQNADTEQDFMDRSQRRVTNVLDEIKPIVGLIASNATTTTTSTGPDPAAAGSGKLEQARRTSTAGSAEGPEGNTESF